MKIFKHFLFSAIALIFISASANAQISFSHSGGAALYVAPKVIASPGAVYSPRLNFLELGDEMTLSIGTHLGLGFAADSQSGISFALDAPLLAEFNFGHGSHNDAQSNFGGFAGIGIGYNSMGDTYLGGNKAAGIAMNAGARFYISDIPFGLRFSYLLNLKSTGADVLGFHAFYTFGM